MNEYEKVNISRLRPLLPECAVLLKYNGAFPLDGPCRIEACGAGVRDTVKGGTGSGEVNSRYFVNVEQGLADAGFEIVNGYWPDRYAEYAAAAEKEMLASIRRTAKRTGANIMQVAFGTAPTPPEYDIPLDLTAEAAVYVVARISGEGSDRKPEKGDFRLTDSEVRDILALDAHYEKFMLVINAGGPVDLSPVMSVGNILVLSQLGVETGSALADILLGRAYPSGKLATTWSRYEDYDHFGEFGLRDDTKYREGIYVGYRSFEARGREPLFPFGYGLGYTSFELSDESVAVKGSTVTVSVTVTNSGGLPGREVAQVYVACPPGKLDKEVKSLAGFSKTKELAPGGSERLEIAFDLRGLASYDEETASYILEKGRYVVLAGNSSRDVTPAGVLSLAETVTVKQVQNRFGSVCFEDYRNERTIEESLADYSGREKKESLAEQGLPYDQEGSPAIELEPGSLTAEGGGARGLREQSAVAGEAPAAQPAGCAPRGSSAAADAVPDDLSDRDLALLNVGAFSASALSIINVGNSSVTVAGAAGESVSRFEDRGIRKLVMADGPAGLRLSREYYEDEKGIHPVGASIPESMLPFLPKPVKWYFSRPPRVKAGVEIKEQYTTAIPIAAALAQSWNPDVAAVCGDIVGSEMEIFGVDLWLAPAMNIHRNVLCGRNFEYFSEDPLLSGRFAAAITNGVQRHKGCGVTIKHFAANNQETNRFASNSMVSERAFREIYLRGFEICIRESDPAALMTSYNLLNGVHTSESRALTTEVLRGEFGFDGLVMTDWIIAGDLMMQKGSKHRMPNAARVAAAGCSLFMPGNKKDYNEILAGLADGTVTREQLKENTGWLIHVINRLNG